MFILLNISNENIIKKEKKKKKTYSSFKIMKSVQKQLDGK